MSKKKSLLPSSVVTQSNKLVEARYNLPLGEQRLILTMIARIQPEDEDFKEYRIDVKEFSDFLGIDRNSVYREFHKIQKSIVSRVLVFYEEDGPLVVGWVSSAKYLDKEGAVILSFDPKLKPYLLQLKGNFTSSKLDMLLSFKSQYTMRVYSLLKQYESLGERQIELYLLREMLGLRKDQNVLYAHFKSNILKPVQKELQLKSDLYFEFDEIKYGRKVGAIHFRIFTKKLIKLTSNSILENNHPVIPSSELSISSTLLDKLLSFVPDHHRTKKTVISSIEAFEKKQGFDYVKRNILYCNAKAEKSYAGFLHTALKNDWGQDWELDQQTPVKNKVKPKEMWERLGYSSEQEFAQSMFDEQMKKFKNK